jgi:two-component system, OmpR family, phosphate regulon response regulator PhoB
MLPVLSGVGVCRQLRDQFTTRDIPVIMLTARAGNHAGADDYIPKPFDLETLLARRFDRCSGGRPPSANARS